MPPDVWVILGDAQARKSSTIRALTGVYNSAEQDIQSTTRRLSMVWVQVPSLQEAKISRTAFQIKQGSRNYILLNLRINSMTIYPDGLAYIQYFISQNWNIQEVVVMGRNTLPYTLPAGVPTHFIPNSSTTPANENAHDIRQQWGWL